MQETKDPSSTGTRNREHGTEAVEPESTATSSDTLSDIEKTEKVSTSTGDKESGGASSSSNDAPSPDGQFDGSSNENSGADDAGPM
jgi:hypothetical protein